MIGSVVLHQQPLFQPTSLTNNGLTEQFTYDADGERLSRTHGGLTTYYIGDWLEYDVQGGAVVAYRFLFRFNGQVVATNTPTQWVFLLADHLSSTSVVADASNNVITTQNFDPWGAIRSGGASQTSVNYTGQQRDDTGLLYYHSRYYNPAIAHFLSPDSIVPGTASPRPLTVDFHEPGFTSDLNQENAFTQGQGFWFQLSSNARSKAKQPWGPANPQALNRYSYAANNPVHNIDPTGHTWYLTHTEAENVGQALLSIGNQILSNLASAEMAILALGAGAASGILGMIAGIAGVSPIVAALAVGLFAGGLSAYMIAQDALTMGRTILANNGFAGEAIGITPASVQNHSPEMFFLNRSTGTGASWGLPPLFYANAPETMRLGRVEVGTASYDKGYHFGLDEHPAACGYDRCQYGFNDWVYGNPLVSPPNDRGR